MATFKTFQEIQAYQEAYSLCLSVYQEIKPKYDFGFMDQIRRAVVSISNNIAEGHGRQTDREFIRFLYYAKGSCLEVSSMLQLAIDLDYIPKEIGTELLNQSCTIKHKINNLIKYLKS